MMQVEIAVTEMVTRIIKMFDNHFFINHCNFFRFLRKFHLKSEMRFFFIYWEKFQIYGYLLDLIVLCFEKIAKLVVT